MSAFLARPVPAKSAPRNDEWHASAACARTDDDARFGHATAASVESTEHFRATNKSLVEPSKLQGFWRYESPQNDIWRCHIGPATTQHNACPPNKRYGQPGWPSPANRRLCGSLGRIRCRITCETFGKPSWHIRRIERRWNWGRCIAHVAAWSLDWLRL